MTKNDMVNLMDEINNNKNKLKNMLDVENVTDEIIAESTALKTILNVQQHKLKMLYDLDTESIDKISDSSINLTSSFLTNTSKPMNGKQDLFLKALYEKLTNHPNSISAESNNVLVTNVDENGGLLIPDDLNTEINDYKRSLTDITQHVNIVNVNSYNGSIVYEKYADTVPFDSLDELDTFHDLNTAQYETIKYELKKFGGVYKTSYEFFKYADINVRTQIVKWAGKKSVATTNFLVFNNLDNAIANVNINDVDGIKEVLNITLDPLISKNSVIVTNQSGYNWLDTLKDSNNNYLLQSDISKKSSKLLFGLYPVVVFSNSALSGNDGIPFYIGDFNEAITLFSSEKRSIDFSRDAYWTSDQLAFKVRELLDVVVVDKNAVVKCILSNTIAHSVIASQDVSEPIATSTKAVK